MYPQEIQYVLFETLIITKVDLHKINFILEKLSPTYTFLYERIPSSLCKKSSKELSTCLEEIIPKIWLMEVPSSMSGITLNIHAIVIDGFFNEFNRKAAIFYTCLHELGHYLQRVDCLTIGEANSLRSDKMRRELEMSKKLAEEVKSGMEIATEETKDSHMAPKANSGRVEGGELLEIRLFQANLRRNK